MMRGRERGYLTPDDAIDVLEWVELRPELISLVIARAAAEGIEWRDPGELLSDEGLDKLAAEIIREPRRVTSSAVLSSGRDGARGLGPGFTGASPLGRGPDDEIDLTAAERDVQDPYELFRKKSRDPFRRGKRILVAGLKLDIGPAGSGSSDSVRAYLKEIGKVRLLSADQEVALARCVERGIVAAARLDALDADAAIAEAASGKGGGGLNGRRGRSHGTRQRSHDQERQADERIRAEGLMARQILVEANLRLVVSVAKWYRNRGLSFLDLIQEGNLGLMRAAEKFDYTKGFKFSTYATWWIRQAISRAIADQARTIRIPVHMVDNINAVVRAQRSLLQEAGREPTIEEVAKRSEMSAERVRDILRISQDTVSLEQPLGEDDFNLSDVLEDDAVPAPSDAATRVMLSEAVRNVLADLSERERKVVRLRFGLDDGQARTLEEVGKEFGVTRERVRQIESKSLAKLRQPLRSGQLRDYLVN